MGKRWSTRDQLAFDIQYVEMYMKREKKKIYIEKERQIISSMSTQPQNPRAVKSRSSSQNRL